MCHVKREYLWYENSWKQLYLTLTGALSFVSDSLDSFVCGCFLSRRHEILSQLELVDQLCLADFVLCKHQTMNR